MSGRAIETRYAARRFRSRLEARWAVFFKTLGVKWDYETQGYIVGGRPYLPDFLLTDSSTWVEVKGDEDELDHSLMLAAARDLPEKSFKNAPGPRLLILGPIPEPPEEGDLGWIGLDRVGWWRGDIDDGGRSFACEIRRGEWNCECGVRIIGDPDPRGLNLCEHLKVLGRRGSPGVPPDEEYVEDQYWGFGRHAERLRPEILTGTSCSTPVQDGIGLWLEPAPDPYAKASAKLAAAYLAARSARFEHGEKGAS